MSAEQEQPSVNPADQVVVSLAPVEAIKQIADKAVALLDTAADPFSDTDLADVADDLRTYLSAISDYAFDVVADPVSDCSREAHYRFIDAASALVDKVV